MNSRETRRYDAFQRVSTFGQDNGADFAAGSNAQANLTIIGQVINGLDNAKAGQKPGVENTTTTGESIARERKTLTMLDAIRAKKYASNPDKMAEWSTAGHIDRDAQRTNPKPPPKTPPKSP